jgi:hypothetical protein
MPNDGTEVHVKSHGPDAGNVNVVEIPGEKLTWKDQVIGELKPGACFHARVRVD